MSAFGVTTNDIPVGGVALLLTYVPNFSVQHDMTTDFYDIETNTLPFPTGDHHHLELFNASVICKQSCDSCFKQTMQNGPTKHSWSLDLVLYYTPKKDLTKTQVGS